MRSSRRSSVATRCGRARTRRTKRYPTRCSICSPSWSRSMTPRGLSRGRITRSSAPEDQLPPKLLSTEHPVVRTHPETGRKGLFVNSIFTASIKGMKPAESGALLNFLYRHIETPDFSCRFRWQPNSIAMWDNRCTQHRVCGDNKTAHRGEWSASPSTATARFRRQMKMKRRPSMRTAAFFVSVPLPYGTVRLPFVPLRFVERVRRLRRGEAGGARG